MEFDRIACAPQENEVIQCEREHLSNMTEKIHILRNWRKNKSTPVKNPDTPIEFFYTDPEILRNREVKATTAEDDD